jgi:flagellar basal body-associated protein FliL
MKMRKKRTEIKPERLSVVVVVVVVVVVAAAVAAVVVCIYTISKYTSYQS